jgi:hypothetical protein
MLKHIGFGLAYLQRVATADFHLCLTRTLGLQGTCHGKKQNQQPAHTSKLSKKVPQ